MKWEVYLPAIIEINEVLMKINRDGRPGFIHNYPINIGISRLTEGLVSLGRRSSYQEIEYGKPILSGGTCPLGMAELQLRLASPDEIIHVRIY